MAELYAGIDTSNYKTSVAVTDSEGKPVFTRSEYLPVPLGKRGLRQSEAFFRHSNILPEFIEDMSRAVDISSVRSIGVSSRPRRTDGSYMPCFLAGLNAARNISSWSGIPYYEFSHQEGHVAAIIEGGADASDECIFMHLSGGTTEFLKCRPDEAGYDLEIIGGTKDISIGQLLDRLGVAMGLPFPSGMYMDETASCYEDPGINDLPNIKYNNGYFNLSGIETSLIRKTESSDPAVYPAIIKAAFDKISSLLERAASDLSPRYDIDRIYMAGGVSSSIYIRNKLSIYNNLIFGDPILSGDNAVGTARLAARMSKQMQ